jgi:hypothetical protein
MFVVIPLAVYIHTATFDKASFVPAADLYSGYDLVNKEREMVG